MKRAVVASFAMLVVFGTTVVAQEQTKPAAGKGAATAPAIAITPEFAEGSWLLTRATATIETAATIATASTVKTAASAVEGAAEAVAQTTT